ncbi:Uma2 family endonuclease [Asanoa siamensis]|uniref:Putative restriction endonuclease domain-containing protein n=1 Tax=Asanoa siamensis TaxID=926357 RepID=A0ABQ4CTZ5_9ACTN|nr:Uma2 family endonuclease [Asanoa siamensis]GIF74748.1 hypothetical protein Asi02nite_42660 [Asanoa siamensis]
MTPDMPAVAEVPWTVDRLADLPESGYRFEIFDGSLLVSPPPAMPHIATTTLLRDALYDQAPRHFKLIESAALVPDARNYYVPDLIVVRAEVLKSRDRGVKPADVLLAIEVVSPSNPSNDLILKRNVYAHFGIPEYWIADRRDESLLVFHLGTNKHYELVAKCHAGDGWQSDRPFPVAIDPVDIFI